MSQIVTILALLRDFKGSGREINTRTTPVQLKAKIDEIEDAINAIEDVAKEAGEPVKKIAEKSKISIFKSYISKEVLEILDGTYFTDKTVEEMKANLVKIFGSVDSKKAKKEANEKYLKMTRLTTGVALPEPFSDFLERIISTVNAFCDASSYSTSLVEDKFMANLNSDQKNFLRHFDWSETGLALLKAQAAKLDLKGFHKKEVKAEINKISGKSDNLESEYAQKIQKNSEKFFHDLTSQFCNYMTREAENRAKEAAALDARFSSFQKSFENVFSHPMSQFSNPPVSNNQWPSVSSSSQSNQTAPADREVKRVATDQTKSQKSKDSKQNRTSGSRVRPTKMKTPCFWCGCIFHPSEDCKGPDTHPKAKCCLCGKSGHFPAARFHHGTQADRSQVFSKN